ncbi:UNVERIFIED_CONTAM: hypothetical protein FKN15_042557 [Acipenser sinensis]
MRSSLAPGIKLITSFSRDSWYRGFTLFLTFLFYTSYHLSRKPISVVKSELHRNCSNVVRPLNFTGSNNETWCDWAPFGLGFYWNIHNIWFYVFAQAMNGLVQTTGWPAVVSCVGNWFGKGKRGLIMGVWNSHTSVGNILGSLIAGVFVSSAWGLSFIVPGIIIGVMGVICFFFLVEKPEDVNCSLPQHHCEQDPNLDSTANEEIFGSPSHSLANGSIPVEPANEEPKAISFVAALRIPGVVEFSLCLLFAKLVSYTFLYWLPLYIANVEPEDVNCSLPQHHCEQDPNLDSTANEEIFGSPSHSLANGSIPVEPANEEPKAISFVAALRIPGVVEFSLCLLFAKLVSYTFLYWLPLYIANVAHFDAKAAGDLSTLFDLGGIFGGILAGVVSDYTGGRATSCCVMLIAAAPMLFVYNRIGEYGLGTTIGMLLLCGGLVNGPYALITTAVAADLGTHESLRGNSKALSTVTAIIDGTGSIGVWNGTHESLRGNSKALSTVTAIIDGTGSIGAALGPLLAGLISPTGWNNVFYMLITADILACLFLCCSLVSDRLQSPLLVGVSAGGILAGVVSDYTGGRATSCCVMLIAAAPMFLSRLVYKEVRGWCGFYTRMRGVLIPLITGFFCFGSSKRIISSRVLKGLTIAVCFTQVMFSRHCSPCDIKELLCSSSNIPSSLYKVIPLSTGQLGEKEDMFQNVLSQVAEQFSRAFRINELKTEVTNRLAMLEKRVELEGLKVVEIEKCKNDLKKLRDEMTSRGSRVNCPCKYNFPDDGKKMTPRRDVPSYPKYTLSQETIEALKKPTFDVWHWEHNEMLSCLEYMYHDLGLVKEFNMNPITLKRWLLSIQENYRSNPFHNFRHCFCVSQMMYGMIHLCNLQEKLTQTDMGILMTAAVCHDLDHPGYNNTDRGCTFDLGISTDLPTEACAVGLSLPSRASHSSGRRVSQTSGFVSTKDFGISYW